jgi:hypothetical protein
MFVLRDTRSLCNYQPKVIRNALILVSVLLVAVLSLTVLVQPVNKVISLKSYNLAFIIQNANNLFSPANPLTESYNGGMPIARAGAMMAHDPISGDDILFGGASSSSANSSSIGVFGDTWSYNGSSWTLLHPKKSPPARAFGAMVSYTNPLELKSFDFRNNKFGIILFGGLSSNGQYLNDTWGWNGSNWVELNTLNHPSARILPAMSLGSGSSTKNSILMYGGLDPSGNALGDTWIFNGNDWVKEHPNASPPPLAGASMSLGPIGPNNGNHNAAILFGGMTGSLNSNPVLLNGTWIWNNNTWAELHPAVSPPARAGAALAPSPVNVSDVSFSSGFPSQDHHVFQDVLFGGLRAGNTLNIFSSYNDTWVWNNNTWTELHPVVSPPALAFGSIAVSQLPPPNQPLLDAGYLPHSNSFVDLIFGGQLSVGLGQDDYSWDGSTWGPANVSAVGLLTVNYARSVLSQLINIPTSEIGVTVSDPTKNGITPFYIPNAAYTTMKNPINGYVWQGWALAMTTFNLVTPKASYNPVNAVFTEYGGRNSRTRFIAESIVLRYNCKATTPINTLRMVNIECNTLSLATPNAYSSTYQVEENQYGVAVVGPPSYLNWKN